MRRALAFALAFGVAAAPAAAAGAPRVHQLVVFRDGSAKQKTVRAARVSVKVQGRRCAIGAGLPLGALVASHVARLGLHDYGSCSRRPRDAGGLFVKSIGPDVNRGQDGWVYKVGLKTATGGAAEPSGPFGRGRLKSGTNVVWFYCHMRGSGCQRTLAFTKVKPSAGGITVSVRAFNDRGRGVAAAGVTVHLDSRTATTDAGGTARLAAGRGRHTLFADGGAFVRTFSRRVVVP